MDGQPLFDSRGFILAGERVEQARSPAIFLRPPVLIQQAVSPKFGYTKG